MAMTLPLTTLGTEWVFNIYEDFAYVTIRSIIFQFISMILMFLLVKGPEDVEVYALISVLASVGSNILNFKYASKYFKHRLIFKLDLTRHLKPVFILFASSVASQIYINADVTMLGFMKGDYAIGIYSASSKIYNIIRLLLSAVITIILPRLSYVRENGGEKDYEYLILKWFSGYMSIVIPTCVGLLCVSKEVITILSGKGFIDSVLSLRILSIALIFSSLGAFIANSILIVNKQEKVILKATCMGAFINIIGNLFLIKMFSYNGAAITTLVSEILVFIIQLFYSWKYVEFTDNKINMVKILCGVGGIITCCYLTSFLKLNNVVCLSVTIITSATAYCLIELLLKQDFVYSIFQTVVTKIKERGRCEIFKK
jgi:O-antigen/teichoic acid export membrane protein